MYKETKSAVLLTEKEVQEVYKINVKTLQERDVMDQAFLMSNLKESALQNK